METLALIGLGVWCFALAVGGGMVGLVLGNLRLPAMVALSSSAAAAAGANLAASALAAAAGGTVHVRAGRVNWRLVGVMTPPSVAFAFLGGVLSGTLPEPFLLTVIAAVLVWSGIDLLRRRHAPPPTVAPSPRLIAAVTSSAVIGFLGGVVGLILGALRMPALLRWVGADPHTAVGTNMVAGVAVGVAGFVGHLSGDGPDWALLTVAAATSVPGALIGARLTGRLNNRQLLTAIGVMLLISAAGLMAKAVS